ncbi:hypothetical protein DTO96_102181 [Ephemeroptericola cinctiostellae]|uniref:Uncharacterized protein n=1 Tax=Ephemeroptericola cinctiostellae TaxID=2268024 RepID=A0A345DDI9_9BURK|nr:hypothetical protein [Ephemeroptericola cinctiostellae]AXF86427.1 hypothetical protein DTO96_102181 [Ephemeroptericola cinctiostellae]
MNPFKNAPLTNAQNIFYAAIFGCVFGVSGYYLNRYYPTIQAELLKTACVLIGVVWGFAIHVYNKLFELTDLSGLSSRQHESLEDTIHSRLKHFWLKAFSIGLLGLVAMFPSIAKEADGDNCIVDCVYSSQQVYFSYIAFGIAFFILMRLLKEQEEIRRVCSTIKQNEREEAERKERLAELK